MGFSSLADELADVLDQGEISGGRSLADEFGLDLGMDELAVGDGEWISRSHGGSMDTLTKRST
jgi:hypothetical protein